MFIKHVEVNGGVYFMLQDETEFQLDRTYITSAVTELNPCPPKWLTMALNEPQKHYVYFHNFSTYHLVRHRGYGRKLLQDVKKYYKGCILYLGVGSCGEMTNEQLIKFYTSEGFNLVENNPNRYAVMAIEL